MSVKLIQVGEFTTREFPIESDVFNIGRDYTCDLRLDHGRISRNHCRVLRRGHRVLVEALYSTVGTAVNQKILDPNRGPVEVHDGDHLWVGPEHFQFVIGEPGERSGPVPVAASTATATATAHAVVPEDTEGAPGDAGGVETLENPLMRDVSVSQSRMAHQILERLATPPPPKPGESAEPEGSLDVAQIDGVTMVRLLAKSLVSESDIRAITDELGELIESGQSCITLHLGNVERMSSQVIGEVFQVYKRCKSRGGTLKICKVSPQVASVFAMTNMQRHIEIFPDEKMAIRSLWPQQAQELARKQPPPQPRTRPRPAPDPAANDPWSKPAEAKPSADEARGTAAPAFSMSAVAIATPPKRVRLVVEVGRAKGQMIEVRGPRFLIGRDQQCHLRPNSNAISRLHTAIDQRDGRVFVRDLNSQTGTVLNGRVLHNEEAEVKPGDRLQIEVLHFTFAIDEIPQETAESPAGSAARRETLGTLFGEPSTDAAADTTIMTIPEFAVAASAPAAAPAEPPPAPHVAELAEAPAKRHRLITSEVVGDVAVLTIRIADLNEESVISAVRNELETLVAELDRNRVVVRFDRVKNLSRGAVVMFLARAQNLVRTQGAMRFCNVSPSVLAFLEKTQLPLLIEIYPTIDEALLSSWGIASDDEGELDDVDGSEVP